VVKRQIRDPKTGKVREPKDDAEWLEFVTAVAVDRRIKSVKKQGTMRNYPPHGAMTTRGVWIPFPDECASCCESVVSWHKSGPKWPFMLYRHCCTLEHISKSFGVDKRALRKAVHKAEGKLKPTAGKITFRLPQNTGPFFPYAGGPKGQKLKSKKVKPHIEPDLVPF
jgi:hypothetical protein